MWSKKIENILKAKTKFKVKKKNFSKEKKKS